MKVIEEIVTFFTNKTSHYYPKKSYYENFLNKYENLEGYMNLVRLDDKQAIFTDKIISFSDNIDFQKNEFKYFEKFYSEPKYVVTNNFPIGEIIIKFYLINIGGLKSKLELHFFQNKLFMYNYTFSNFENNTQDYLINMLKEKYLTFEEKDIVLENCYIIDKNNTIITLSDSIDFTINYVINIESDLFCQINNVFMREKKIEEQRKRRDRHELYKRI